MKSLLLIAFLFGLALSQGAGECGASPPLTKDTMPPQKVAYVQIEWTGRGLTEVMQRGHKILQKLFSTTYAGKGHTSTLFMCTETSCLSGIDLSTYTQVWVNDNSRGSDDAASMMSGYRKIADWFTTTMAKPHIICDGRIRSSLWDGRGTAFNGAVPQSAGKRPNEKIVENYFVNLGIRGGGLLLGTDHAPYWTDGINFINDYIGIQRFKNNFDNEPNALEIDSASPVMNYPTIGGDFPYNGKNWLWDDSSTSDSPLSEQSNGQILYPIGWHGGIGLNRPGVSTTIRGGVGFLIDIVSPTCGQLFLKGDAITFTGKQTAGDQTVKNEDWVWHSSVDGSIGKGKTITTSKLTPGQHIVVLRAEDKVQKMIAVAKVVIYVTFSSGKAECLVLARDGSQVFEYFPIKRAQSAVTWFSYGSPIAGRANTRDHIEDKHPLSANFGLFDDGDGKLSLVWVNSKNTGPAVLNVDVTLTSTGGAEVNPSLVFVDSPNDLSVQYDKATKKLTARWNFQLTTKGFVLGKIPNGFTDRWCINIDVNTRTTTGLNWMTVFGHVTPPTSSAEPLIGYQYGDKITKKFQFCRTQCNCAGAETRTTMVGRLEPVRVNQGNDGSIDEAYKRNLVCTWIIAPTDGVTPVTHIILWWTAPFNVNPVDSVSVYKGKDIKGEAIYAKLNGKTVPATQIVQTSAATAFFTTTDVLKTEFGWILNWAVQPKPVSLSPTKGVLTEPTVVTITGTNFHNGPNFRVQVKVGGVTVHTLTPTSITPTRVVVSIPPQAKPADGQIYITNDFNSGIVAGPLAYNWYDASCNAVSTCKGCTVRPECGWCNSLAAPGGSFCMPIGGDKSCPEPANKLDRGCCTQCSLLRGCSKPAGNCSCDDTCVCDKAHWGPDCSCKQCPIGANGKICSGTGVCGCDGVCTCDATHRGADCACLKCGGIAGPCENHGTCGCDGKCTCDAGWTHPVPTEPFCGCSTTCPANCSNNGICKCGVCDCDAEFTSLPDCSCRDCKQSACPANQECGCSGDCECKPGFHGENCDIKSPCAEKTACQDCLDTLDCGWCDGANLCENIYELDKCARSDKKNPRGFQLVETCPVAVIGEEDVLSEDKSSVLLAAIAGSLLAASLGLAAMAYLLKGFAMSPMFADGIELADGVGFNQSSIYESGGTEHTSGIFQA